MTSKVCTSCGIKKLIVEFYVKRYMGKDGIKNYRQSHCKDCSKKGVRRETSVKSRDQHNASTT